jgi:hypothetical protein
MSVPCPIRIPRALLAALASLLCLAPAAAAVPAVSPPKTGVSATLEQCLSVGEQAERAATFAGEMTTIPGSTRMEMRIDVIERMPGEIAYHTVSAPGLGVWRGSAPGVKAYRYLKQVTNLAGPAFYRGVVRYRWLNSRGRLLSASTLRTRRCEQPATEPMTSGSGVLAAPVANA